ncbi:hypothetical protein [Photobacterium leiognathi]|uniref:hypothetical protein n=1 Tax=Photobacterium leiognathi TaxID=553611 RepID=UPI002981DACC|nr:hypothetical protein [Photobacterium leiognathi]
MKNALIDRLTTLIGEPTRETKKLVSWTITSGFGLAVQTDSPSHNEFAWVWVPFNDDIMSDLKAENQVYSEDKGRHSNTYPVPGLGKGQAAIRIKVASDTELNEFLEFYKI